MGWQRALGRGLTTIALLALLTASFPHAAPQPVVRAAGAALPAAPQVAPPVPLDSPPPPFTEPPPESLPAQASIPAPAAETLASLPVPFVPNQGQLDQRFRFQAHGRGATLSFGPASVALQVSVVLTQTRASGGVELHDEGGNPAAAIVGADLLPGVVNYLLGSDPAQWQIGVPTYGSLGYTELYPGINLSYTGRRGCSRAPTPWHLGLIPAGSAGATEVPGICASTTRAISS